MVVTDVRTRGSGRSGYYPHDAGWGPARPSQSGPWPRSSTKVASVRTEGPGPTLQVKCLPANQSKSRMALGLVDNSVFGPSWPQERAV